MEVPLDGCLDRRHRRRDRTRQEGHLLLTVARDIARAVDVLRAGGLVAFPTETVYGLGADATNEAAIARIFTVKGRPTGHPLIVHLGDGSWIGEWSHDLSADAGALADAFWPGPLTMVVRRSSRVPDAVTGGRDTVGLRVPGAAMALELLRAFGGGIAAPSANRFGRVSPTTAADVRADLGDDVDVVVDGGACAVGLESTIVELTGDVPMLLRPGAISAGDIEAVIGRPITRTATGPARAPGMLESHYAPRARVELVADVQRAAERAGKLLASGAKVGVLASGAVGGVAGAVDLGPAGEPAAYAQALYRHLRDADRLGLDVLVVVPPPDEGIGAAIRDRLTRAAGP